MYDYIVGPNWFPFFDFQIYALNKVMTELEQQQFEGFCKQMQSQSESWDLLWILRQSEPGPDALQKTCTCTRYQSTASRHMCF